MSLALQRARTNNLTTAEKTQKWLHHCRGSDRAFKGFRNKVGAGRLEDVALRSFVVGRRGLMGAGLGDLEWGIGKRVLDVLVRSDLLSVALWMHFAFAYSFECPWEGDVHSTVSLPEADVLFDVIPAISSPGGLFLTSLILYSGESRRADPGFDSAAFDKEAPSMELSRAQWMQLANLDNLAVLITHGSFGGTLVDQVVRAWVNRHVFDGAFSHLRALALVNQDTLTLSSLRELAKFKSLAVVRWSALALANVKHIGGYGWKPAEDYACFTKMEESVKRPLLKISCGPRFIPESWLTATLVPDPDWRASNKRQLEQGGFETAGPAPPKRPSLRKGVRKNAASLLNQFSGM